MIATMFSAVNIPTPRVVFGMVVSGGGVRLLGVGGCAQSGAVVLWALGVQSWPATRSGGLFGLVICPVRAAKRAAHSSRPSWVVVSCRRLSQPDARCAINLIADVRICALSPFCVLCAENHRLIAVNRPESSNLYTVWPVCGCLGCAFALLWRLGKFRGDVVVRCNIS